MALFPGYFVLWRKGEWRGESVRGDQRMHALKKKKNKKINKHDDSHVQSLIPLKNTPPFRLKGTGTTKLTKRKARSAPNSRHFINTHIPSISNTHHSTLVHTFLFCIQFKSQHTLCYLIQSLFAYQLTVKYSCVRDGSIASHRGRELQVIQGSSNHRSIQ